MEGREIREDVDGRLRIGARRPIRLGPRLTQRARRRRRARVAAFAGLLLGSAILWGAIGSCAWYGFHWAAG